MEEKMSDEKQQEKFCEPEELYEMFNCSFLPKLQELAKRAKKIKFPEDEIAFYNVNMFLQFDDSNEPLIYQNIEEKINLQLQPVTQKQLEESQKEAENVEDSQKEDESV
jgi:hypothetical protein